MKNNFFKLKGESVEYANEASKDNFVQTLNIARIEQSHSSVLLDHDWLVFRVIAQYFGKQSK